MVHVVIIKIVRLTKNSYSYLLVFSKIKKMDRNVIHNLADHYTREYNVLDFKDNLMKLIENHGNQPFYILRYLSLVKNFLIINKNLKYTIEVPSRREYLFLEDLTKECFIQVIKWRTMKELLNSKFLGNIYFTVNVYK